MNPRCTINHADGTSTVIMLIARTRYADFTSVGGDDKCTILRQRANESDAHTWQEVDFLTTDQAWGDSTERAGPTAPFGPYPVFMTVQELVELIEVHTDIGDVDTEKEGMATT